MKKYPTRSGSGKSANHIRAWLDDNPKNELFSPLPRNLRDLTGLEIGSERMKRKNTQ
ncbi:hypothetical protein RAM19_10065 [Bartonella apihabitans]|nr:hypothetical protein [Bartonella apihabitans]WLT08375.1 hypothetical protein RAM19_10065 [Bartonella apihabitans]